MGCPYCAGQKPTADRNLATKHPSLWRSGTGKGITRNDLKTSLRDPARSSGGGARGASRAKQRFAAAHAAMNVDALLCTNLERLQSGGNEFAPTLPKVGTLKGMPPDA